MFVFCSFLAIIAMVIRCMTVLMKSDLTIVHQCVHACVRASVCLYVCLFVFISLKRTNGTEVQLRSAGNAF